MRRACCLAILVFVGSLPLAKAENPRDQAMAIQKIEALGGEVERAADANSDSIVTISLVGCSKLTDEDLKFLAVFPNLKELLLAGAIGVSDAGIDQIIQCRQLTSLGLARTQVTDEGMKKVAKLNQLEHLQLSHTSVSDKGIANLGRLPKLQSLTLNNTSVTDDGLKELAEFQNLTTINVKQSHVTAGGLSWLRDTRPKLETELPFAQQAVNVQSNNVQSNVSNSPTLEPQSNDTPEQRASLEKLKALDGSVERDEDGNVTDITLIGSAQLKDDDLELVKPFPQIRGLYLGGTAITGTGLKHISDFKNLRTIGLIGTRIVDESLKNLSKLDQLEELYLANTSITDAGVANLGRLPGLRELLLAHTKITDESLKELAEFPSLIRLTLQGTSASDEALARLRELRPFLQAMVGTGGGGQAAVEFKPTKDDPPELIQAADQIKSVGGTLERGNAEKGNPVTDITLIGSKTLNDQDLEFLKLFPDLTFLALGWTNISNDGLKLVSHCPKLQVLGLINTKVDDEGMKDVAKLKQLERLFLSMTVVTDEGIANLGRLPNLQAIMLANTKLTDEGLKELAEFKNLNFVNLSGTSVTDDGKKWLSEARPDIQIMDGQQAGGSGGGGGGGGGGQRGDPDFDTTVANPVYTDSHPAVLFDEAHDNFHTASGRYKAFADMMSNDGYSITRGTRSLTPDLLAGYQILLIANATTNGPVTTSAFTPEECDCVQKWVNAGGSLLLITDHEPFGSASIELAKPFGVRMGCSVASDAENETSNGLLFARENLQISNHPIMSGRDASERVDRVLTFTGQSLKGPPGSWQLLRFSETATKWSDRDSPTQKSDEPDSGLDPRSAVGECQGLALKFGKGRVVVMGEAAELSAQMVGENPTNRFGMNVPGCDNRKMALNIMHWLSHVIDPDQPNRR